jgi:basic membrane protein A
VSNEKKNLSPILIIAVLVLAVAAILYFTVLRGDETDTTSTEGLRFGMVTDVGGLGDQSFNDSAHEGLQRAAAELGAEITVVESKAMDQYETNLRNLAEQGYDMIWGIGFLLTDAVKNVAEQYPDIKFGLIDASFTDADGNPLVIPNVQNVLFKENEGSFLVGVIAAMTTKTNVVGFVGGMQLPLIEKFEAGFIAGVRAVNPDITILSAYTGKFDDPAKGKELALAQFGQNADVVYHASGSCGIGVIEAAKERGLWAIGVDSDQNHLAPENVLTSMMKRVDVGVFNGCKAVAEGTFEPGIVTLGLPEGGVGYAPTSYEDVDAEILAHVDELAAKIAAGEIMVPETPAEAKMFVLE